MPPPIPTIDGSEVALRRANTRKSSSTIVLPSRVRSRVRICKCIYFHVYILYILHFTDNIILTFTTAVLISVFPMVVTIMPGIRFFVCLHDFQNTCSVIWLDLVCAFIFHMCMWGVWNYFKAIHLGQPGYSCMATSETMLWAAYALYELSRMKSP